VRDITEAEQERQRKPFG